MPNNMRHAGDVMLQARVPARLKRAVVAAARDDNRSTASYLNQILTEHLAAAGYLQKETSQAVRR